MGSVYQKIYSKLSLRLSPIYSASVLIGAPKANTTQASVTEGGSVFYCPWSLTQSDCHTIEFDTEGKFDKDDKDVRKISTAV